MVKYFLTYKGIGGDTYLFEILEDSYDGEPIEIHGYVNHNYADRKDLVQPTIASSLDISLEADENLTLQDLYTEEESKFKCSLKRNDHTIFYGILKPDGIWEDFVSDRWEISMDAMDGLSILKDLSFVKDDGTFYIGKITQFDALKQCLKRIGYELPINISDSLPYYVTDARGAGSVLKYVLINADRFYQDAQKNNIMDCEAVLKSVLEIYSATIVQMNGEWWVFRPIDVQNEMNFYRYDGEEMTEITWNAELNIGSHIDNYDIFHANANQKKSINASTQAFRVNYKYGTVKSIAENPELEYTAGSWTGWNVNTFSGSVIPNEERGIIIVGDIDETPDLEWISNSQSIEVTENDKIDVIFSLVNSKTAIFVGGTNILCYSFETDNFIMSEAGWLPKPGNEAEKLVREYGKKPDTITDTFNLPGAPEDSNLIIKIWIRQIFVDYPAIWPFYLNRIEVVPNSNANYKGEFHTAQRLTRISSVTKADKTVNNGDSISDIYYGTLYKANGEPTDLWGSGKPLLQIMVEDALRIAPRPMYFFEGDVFGYFPYLTNILINNVPGKYQVSKYSFDTKRNVNKTNFKEFDNVNLIEGTDYRYEFDYDYGNETRVTIKS